MEKFFFNVGYYEVGYFYTCKIRDLWWRSTYSYKLLGAPTTELPKCLRSLSFKAPNSREGGAHMIYCLKKFNFPDKEEF